MLVTLQHIYTSGHKIIISKEDTLLLLHRPEILSKDTISSKFTRGGYRNTFQVGAFFFFIIRGIASKMVLNLFFPAIICKTDMRKRPTCLHTPVSAPTEVYYIWKDAQSVVLYDTLNRYNRTHPVRIFQTHIPFFQPQAGLMTKCCRGMWIYSMNNQIPPIVTVYI